MRLLSARLCLVAVLGLFAAGTLRAVPVANLYQATVTVPSTRQADRAAAFSEALKKVMVRIAGNTDVLDRQQLADAFSHSESLVQSYRYEKGPDDQDELQVSFGPVGVNTALAKAGVPVWGANRPLMVVWAAVDTGANRILVTPASGDWTQAFNQAAQTWGLPIILPRYDANDRAALNLSEIWGQFMDSISAASQRYHADLVVAARISGQNGQWQGAWQMQGKDVQAQGNNQADSPGDLATAMAQAWASELAKRYAVSPGAVGSDQSVDLAIKGVNGLGSYAAVRQALRGITPIQAVVPVTIRPDELVLRVTFAGELTVLQQYIALDHRFQVEETPSPALGEPLSNSSAPETLPLTSEPISSAPVPITGVMPTSGPAANSSSYASVNAGVQGTTPGATADTEAQTGSGSGSFSRLYPRLDYRWTGGAAPKPVGNSPVQEQGGRPAGSSPGGATSAPHSSPLPGSR